MKGLIIDKDGTLFHYGYVWGSVVSDAVVSGLSKLGLKGEKLNKTAHKFEMYFGVDREGNNYKNGILFRPDLIVLSITKMVIASLAAGLNPFKVKDIVFVELSGIGDRIKNEIANKDFPGLKELFFSLKERGYKIGIVTNDNEATTRLFLSYIGIEDCVDFIRGDGKGAKKKPNPEAFNQFIKEFGLKREDVAVIGDSKQDMDFAKRAKAGYKVAVLTGSGDEKLLYKMADAVYPTILDIAKDPVLFCK